MDFLHPLGILLVSAHLLNRSSTEDLVLGPKCSIISDVILSSPEAFSAFINVRAFSSSVQEKLRNRLSYSAMT